MTSTDSGLKSMRRLPARPERGLAGNIAYSVLGQLFYVLTQMVILAALARLRGAEAIGEFGLALAVVTPIFMMANMGVRTSQASDVTARFTFSEYGGLIVMLATTALVISLAVGCVLAPTSSAFAILAIMSGAKAFEAISNLSYGAFQQAGRMDRVAGSLLLRGILTASVFVSLLLAGADTGHAFLAQLFVWGGLAVCYDYPRACLISSGAWSWPSFQLQGMVRVLKETAPIGAGHFMNSFLVSLPRLFVERSLGLHALGLFTVVGYFQQAATLVVNGVSQALVNSFARFRRDQDGQSLRRASAILFSLAAGASFAAVVFVHFLGEEILGRVFGPDFRQAKDVLLLITLAVCMKFFATIPQSLMHADRRFTAYFWYQAASLLVCLVLLMLLVPPLGLVGAGYAVLAVAVFRLLVLLVATFHPARKSGTEATPVSLS